MVAFRRVPPLLLSQCTFWCSVLSDRIRTTGAVQCRVSMHLLVLSAFRHGTRRTRRILGPSLNAPFGAQCFPTRRRSTNCAFRRPRLNAPFGAQCFPTFGHPVHEVLSYPVSMHLLVLSAFRPEVDIVRNDLWAGLNAPFGAQCFPTRDRRGAGLLRGVSMHLLVLSAFRQRD